jgi:hypothetical protein
MPLISTAEQERLLKLHAVTYFRELELENPKPDA